MKEEEEAPVINFESKTWASAGLAIQEFLEDLESDDPDMNHITGPITLTFPGFEKLVDDSDVPPLSAVTNGDTDSNAVADEDTTMAEAEAAAARPATHRRSTSLSNKRKSSASQAEAEAGNVRSSKRVRNREVHAAEKAAAAAPAMTQREMVSSDERLFSVASRCFEPLGLSIGTAASLRPIPPKKDDDDEAPHSPVDAETYVKDFKAILMGWDDDKGNVVLYGEGIPK